jgi:hypothetical protein
MATLDAYLYDETTGGQDYCLPEAGVLVHDVDSYPGVFPEVADLVLTPPTGLSPEIDSVAVIDPTHVRCIFVSPALRNSALSNPDNYTITPTLVVHAVVPEPVSLHVNPTYVDLTIDEQKTGENYLLSLNRIEAA